MEVITQEEEDRLLNVISAPPSTIPSFNLPTPALDTTPAMESHPTAGAVTPTTPSRHPTRKSPPAPSTSHPRASSQSAGSSTPPIPASNLPTGTNSQTRPTISQPQGSTNVAGSSSSNTPPSRTPPGRSLQDPRGTSTPRTTPPTRKEIAEDLLTSRKDLKKATSNLARVESHLEFLDECASSCLVPTGLKINVQCNALLSSYTDVKQRFDRITTEGEMGFRSSLIYHYKRTRENLMEELQTIKDVEDLTLQSADTREVNEHEAIKRKMSVNVNKLQEQLAERKKKKIETLRQRAKEASTGQGRGKRGEKAKQSRKRGKNKNRGGSKATTTEHLPQTTPQLPYISPQTASQLIGILKALEHPGRDPATTAGRPNGEVRSREPISGSLESSRVPGTDSNPNNRRHPPPN